MPMLAIIILLGLFIGSSLNVCIWRLPRAQSTVWPGSYCPACGHDLQAGDLIPLLSFVLRRGSCRYCGQAIAWRYPLVEAGTALGMAALYAHSGWGWQFLQDALLFCGLLVASAIDMELRIIPNRLLTFMTLAFLMLCLLFSPERFWPAFWGALSAGLLLLAPALLYPGGMGGGDIKMAAVIGLYLGWPSSLLAIFLGILIGAAAGLGWMVRQHKDLKAAIPLGPFLSLGAMLTLLWGEQILAWYKQFY